MVLAGLALTIPVLLPYHAYPLLTFYGEWMALLLGLMALAPMLFVKKEELPKLPWMSVALFGFCVLLYLQMAVGLVAYPQRSVTGVMYALWAALLIWLGVWLRTALGLERATIAVAVFLAAGAWLLAISGFMQYFDIQTAHVRFIEPAKQVGMYGVLAQRNLFANYVACGLLATGYLLLQRRIGSLTAILIGMPLAVALAYSGARSAWMYAVVLLVLFLWIRHRSGAGHPGLRGVAFAVAACAVFVLVRVGPASEAVPRADDLAPWEWLPQRIEDFAQVPIAPRLLLAWHALLQFKSHPLMGVGFGEFAWNLYQNTFELEGNLTPGIDRHAHNLFLHLMAETGAIGVALIGGGMALWMMGLRKFRLQPAAALAVALLAIQFLHSLVEFPLWHAQFLGLSAMLLGLTGEGALEFGRSRLGRLVCRLVIMGGLAIAILYFKGYRDYEQWYVGTVAAEKASKLDPEAQVSALLQLEYSWMFLPYFDLVVTEGMPVTRENLELKLSMNAQAMRLFPIPSAVARQAMLLSLAGRHEEAWSSWRRLRIIYPVYEMHVRDRLVDLAGVEPAMLPLVNRMKTEAGKL